MSDSEKKKETKKEKAAKLAKKRKIYRLDNKSKKKVSNTWWFPGESGSNGRVGLVGPIGLGSILASHLILF